MCRIKLFTALRYWRPLQPVTPPPLTPPPLAPPPPVWGGSVVQPCLQRAAPVDEILSLFISCWVSYSLKMILSTDLKVHSCVSPKCSFSVDEKRRSLILFLHKVSETVALCWTPLQLLRPFSRGWVWRCCSLHRLSLRSTFKQNRPVWTRALTWI